MQIIWDFFADIGLTQSVFQFMLVNIILALSIFITLYAGIFSLANIGFMAIGAYAGVISTQTFGLPLWAGILVGMIITGTSAYFLGLPVLRLQDIYLAIATIGFGEIVRIMILNFDSLLSVISGKTIILTGNALGIKGIPKITQTWHLLVFIFLALLILHRLGNSRYGRAMRALRDDEQIASGMGINIVKMKSAMFVLSAILAGAAGVFSGHLTRIISPGVFNFARVVDTLAFAVLGGTTTWAGPVVGAAILTAIPELARPLKAYNQIFNGIVLLLVIVYLPNGVADPKLWGKIIRKIKQRKQ
ncbi:MAG: branched-chain amino acid ABC transporter permease [Anaerolineales bacterium]|nr:branched-chain amino acid ABC transporter permease [Chloroflexota bacterium]MBL6983715.1 branched-chain amino acid ABC transporter permease [Anaerolineales bacterium]